MRGVPSTLLCLLLLAHSASAFAAADRCPRADDARYLPHEVILKFERGARRDERETLLAAMSAELLREFPGIGAAHYRLAGRGVAETLARFGDSPLVDYLTPNHRLAYDLVPDDPYFDRLWGLENTGQTVGTPGADISAPEAWNLLTAAPDVIVAVLDSGVDLTHPDLAANLWVNAVEIPGNGIDDDGNGYVDDVRGWDFHDDDNDPGDAGFHGTQVAGVIGQVGDNGLGGVGVAWSVAMMPLKVGGAEGGNDAAAIAAIEYAADMGARVINASWGSYYDSPGMREAIEYAGSRGALFVASAGNDGLDVDSHPHYPSGYDLPNVIAVASTDHNDELASSSNHGFVSVDLGAPGVDIYTTLPGSFGYGSGTSMAAPHVSGVAALVWQRYPGIQHVEVRDLLLFHSDIVPGLAGRVATEGRLNAFLPLGEISTTLTRFDVEREPGAVTLRWTLSDPTAASECRLDVSLGDVSWRPEVRETAPGRFEAHDDADALMAGGLYSYELRARTEQGWLVLRSGSLSLEAAPRVTALLPAWPNPFNPHTTIPFTLADAGRVRVSVYDLAGRRVVLLLDERRSRGRHEVVWRGRDDMGRRAASGVYLLRMEAPGFTRNRKLVLLR